MKPKLQLLETHSNTAISWILQSKYDKLTLRKRRVNHSITLIAKSKNNIPNQYHSTHSFTKRQSTKAKLLSLNWKKEKYNASRFINWGSNSIEKKMNKEKQSRSWKKIIRETLTKPIAPFGCREKRKEKKRKFWDYRFSVFLFSRPKNCKTHSSSTG